jgi:hypothetical protein
MQPCPVTARRRRRGLFNVLTFGLANRKELSFKDWCRQELQEPEHEAGGFGGAWTKGGGGHPNRGHRKDVGGYEVRKGHYMGEEVGRGRSRHRYAGNPLTSTRRRMPASDFALPISAQSAKFKASHPKNAGAYPMFDRAHASNARSRATQMLNSGWLTLKEAQTIYNRTSDRWGFAYKKLEHTPSGKWRSVKVTAKPRLRAAANKMYDINW